MCVCVCVCVCVCTHARALRLKMTDLWDVASCSLVSYQRTALFWVLRSQ